MKKSVIMICLLISGLAQAQTNTNSLQKVRYVKTVLMDILYRGGGPGGQVLLPAPALNSLCEAGFSSAVYLYPGKDRSPRSVECTDNSGKRNQLVYSQVEFRDMRPILNEVYRAITKDEGPVYVHCWNGWHASGEVAAKALMQFCGWSGQEAGRYWANNIGDRQNLPRYGRILDRISAFKPYADLQISSALQQEICPNK